VEVVGALRGAIERHLPGVSEDKQGAQAAVLHVNVAWLLGFVCNVNRSGRAMNATRQ
jgi:hypothetical protein